MFFHFNLCFFSIFTHATIRISEIDRKFWHFGDSLRKRIALPKFLFVTKCRFNNNNNEIVLFQRIFKKCFKLAFSKWARTQAHLFLSVSLSLSVCVEVYRFIKRTLFQLCRWKFFIACQPLWFSMNFSISFAFPMSMRFATRETRCSFHSTLLYAKANTRIYFYCRDNVIYCAYESHGSTHKKI